MTRSVGESSSPFAGLPEATTNRTLGVPGQVAVVGLVVAGVIVGTRNEGGLFYSSLGFIPYAGIGAILVIRRPRTSIGWILLGLGWAQGIVGVRVPGTMEQFANATFDMPGDLFAVVHNASIGALFYLYVLLTLLFPSGRLPTGRWGWLGRVVILAGLVIVAAGMVMPIINAEITGYPAAVPVRNPIAFLPDLAIWRVISPDTVGFPLLILMLPAVVSLVVRLRRSRGTERQQLRWIAASIGFVVTAVVTGFAVAILVPGTAESGLAWFPALVAFPTVPIAVGIAVLRYRLYEIDRIISRTVGWALVTSLLGAVFAVLVVGLQALFATFTGGSTLAVAASTLVAAALFQPLRRRVQAAVDHRFNRARYDAQRTAEVFTEQLRNEVDLARLRVALVDTVESAVRPVSATVWLRAGSDGRG
jgi:hypothetical protein